MAHLACPCGNSIWNGCDGDEVEYEFIPNAALEEHADDLPFFELQYIDGLHVNMWRCDICDRMMVFDDESKPVSRFLKRISTDDLPEAFTSLPHVDGLAINNCLFNEVDRHFTYTNEHNEEPGYTFILPAEDPSAPLLTPSVMQREIFSHKNGRFSDWWYASLYDDYLVFYSPYDPLHENPPVKAWQRYEQIWPEHEEPEGEILEEADDAEESEQ